MPTLQESTSITACLKSLQKQSYTNIVEVLVVDGGSRDGTREIVESFGLPIQLLDNPKITAASAMNIGMNSATGDVIVRIDAHSTFSEDYVEKSVEVLLTSGATIVGGPMRPHGSTKFGEAVAAVTSSPLAVGPGRFHYSEVAGPVDTVYLGTFFRCDVMSLGGYDTEELQWAAEDQELNFRIKKANGIVYLDPSIKSWYVPRGSPMSLARQYKNYGLAKASTLKKHGRFPTWRPFAPLILVLSSFISIIVGALCGDLLISMSVLSTHLIFITVGSVVVTWRRRTLVWRSICATAICHWAYGVGLLQGILRIVLGKNFDTKPKSHQRV